MRRTGSVVSTAKRVGALVAALTVAASLASCGALGDDSSSSSDSSGATGAQLEKTKIKVGVLPVVDVAPLHYAIENGYFKAEGLEVEPVTMASGPASVNGIINGDLDIAFASYPAPLVAQSKKVADFKIVAEALAARPGHIVVVATPNSSVKAPEQLVGKKIAITARNSFTDLAPMSVMKTKGVDFSGITWVEMAFPDMLPAMERGDVDAAVLVEPWVTRAEKQLGAIPVLDGASGPTAEIPMSGYMAIGGEGKFATSSPKTIAAFQKALQKAQAEVSQDRTKAEPMFVKYAKIDEATAKLVTISTYSTSLEANRVQRVSDLLEEFSVIKAHLDVAPMLIAPKSS